MRIREYTSGDLDALRHLHAAQGFAYPLPDLDSPLFVTRLVLEDDSEGEDRRGNGRHSTTNCHSERSEESLCPSGEQNREILRCARNDHKEQGSSSSRGRSAPRIVMAALLRLTAETYLLHDPRAGTPRQRWQRLLALHEAARRDAAARGLDDVQAFLPPPIARSFGRRLARLGWTPDPWPCFSRRV